MLPISNFFARTGPTSNDNHPICTETEAFFLINGTKLGLTDYFNSLKSPK